MRKDIIRAFIKDYKTSGFTKISLRELISEVRKCESRLGL